MCLSNLAEKQKLVGKAAFYVKSHIKVQALLQIPDTLCARAHSAASETEITDTNSTSVICIVYTSSTVQAMVHRSSAELCQGGLSQHFCFCWDAGRGDT